MKIGNLNSEIDLKPVWEIPYDKSSHAYFRRISRMGDTSFTFSHRNIGRRGGYAIFKNTYAGLLK